MSRLPSKLITAFIAAFLLCMLAVPASATWSIVVADTDTGEVGIACATCLLNMDLKKGTGVVVVGKGAANAQALLDSTGENRQALFQGLLDGLNAQELLDMIKTTDPTPGKHQYGIATLQGDASAWTGSGANAYKGHLTGKSGSLAYAIQGNVLTGAGVLIAAEEALVQTQGDLGQKLMMAMHAAKSYGGDGRCSCSAFDPTGCGCPPPSFKKSAHVSFMVIARIGDTDGVCGKETGCANGSYYLDLGVKVSSPTDPVDVLQGFYDDFRTERAGHADHILSQKTVYPEKIVADGTSKAELMIALVDIDDFPISHGGASVSVTHDESSAGSTSIGPVTDYGDGTYSVTLTSSPVAGKDVFRVVVDDGTGPVTLYPFPTLDVETPTLMCDSVELHASSGSPIMLSLDGPKSLRERRYLILGSASGTEPGFMTNGVHVPLNIDLFTLFLYSWISTPVFPSGLGLLDAEGDGKAIFDTRPMQLFSLVGTEISFSWITLTPVDFSSNPVSVSVVP